MLTLFDKLLTHCFDKSLFSCKDLVAVMIKCCCYSRHMVNHIVTHVPSAVPLCRNQASIQQTKITNLNRYEYVFTLH